MSNPIVLYSGETFHCTTGYETIVNYVHIPEISYDFSITVLIVFVIMGGVIGFIFGRR